MPGHRKSSAPTPSTAAPRSNGWKGFSQQLAHTAPPDLNPDTYDDLVTVVLHKGNASIYAGFAQVKKTGERANSSEKAEQLLQQALSRLDT